MSDPELDEIVKELVEWMDGWYLSNDGKRFETESIICPIFELQNSLDLIREIEEAVEDEGLLGEYGLNLNYEIDGLATFMADPKNRLIALHRTFDEAGKL
jgi:hypothetical protein